MDKGRSSTERARTATEQYAAEVAKLNEPLAAGAVDQATYARAVEDANDRALRSSQAWTDGATRFLKDYVAESNDAATATEQAFANAFSGAEDSLVGFISSGKLEFRGLADSILADVARTTVRQTITAPLAGALRSAFAGDGLLGLFHQGGIAGERPPDARNADAGIFDHAPRYHGGGFAGSGLLPDEVPIIARRGELVVPPERVVREEKTAREQRPITVVVNVTSRRQLLSCEPGPDRGRYGARHRPGEPESLTEFCVDLKLAPKLIFTYEVCIVFVYLCESSILCFFFSYNLIPDTPSGRLNW